MTLHIIEFKMIKVTFDHLDYLIHRNNRLYSGLYEISTKISFLTTIVIRCPKTPDFLDKKLALGDNSDSTLFNVLSSIYFSKNSKE